MKYETHSQAGTVPFMFTNPVKRGYFKPAKYPGSYPECDSNSLKTLDLYFYCDKITKLNFLMSVVFVGDTQGFDGLPILVCSFDKCIKWSRQKGTGAFEGWRIQNT